MKAKLPSIARVLFGLLYLVPGILGLFNLMPPPENLPEKMMTFSAGLMAAGYFFPLLKITEIICGLLLLAGMFVPLALVILAPITIHIFMVHAFLAPDGIILAVVLVALQIYLSFFVKPYSEKIKSLFKK